MPVYFSFQSAWKKRWGTMDAHLTSHQQSGQLINMDIHNTLLLPSQPDMQCFFHILWIMAEAAKEEQLPSWPINRKERWWVYGFLKMGLGLQVDVWQASKLFTSWRPLIYSVSNLEFWCIIMKSFCIRVGDCTRWQWYSFQSYNVISRYQDVIFQSSYPSHTPNQSRIMQDANVYNLHLQTCLGSRIRVVLFEDHRTLNL